MCYSAMDHPVINPADSTKNAEIRFIKTSKFVGSMRANGNLELQESSDTVDVRERELLDAAGICVCRFVFHRGAQLRKLTGIEGQVQRGAGNARLQFG